MSTKSIYKIFSNYNLVVEIYEGILTLDLYINIKRAIFKNPLYKPNMSFLIHLKNADLDNISSEDLNKLVTFKKSKKKLLGRRNIALITKAPSQVVTGILYKESNISLNLEVDIFSTEEKALNWLLDDDENAKNIIHNYIKLN